MRMKRTSTTRESGGLKPKLAVAVFFLVLTGLAVFAVWKRGKMSRPAGVPILGYHQFKLEPETVYDIHPQVFRRQMEYLRRNGYRVVPLLQLVRALETGEGLPEKTVVLTIDDGFKSVYQHAYPVLKEFGYPATLFLYIGFINEKGASVWWPQIEEMIAGGIDIGSHTFSHLVLTRGADESEEDYDSRLERELLKSKHYLEQKLNIDVPWFSYPYGAYDPAIKEKVAACGYRAAVVLNGGVVGPWTDRYALNRKLVAGTMSEREFARALRYYPIKVSRSFPVDGGRLRRSQLKDFTLLLPDWENRGPLRMTINGEYMDIVYGGGEGQGHLRLRTVPHLNSKANCVNVLGDDEEGNHYVHSFLFWLQ